MSCKPHKIITPAALKLLEQKVNKPFFTADILTCRVQVCLIRLITAVNCSNCPKSSLHMCHFCCLPMQKSQLVWHIWEWQRNGDAGRLWRIRLVRFVRWKTQWCSSIKYEEAFLTLKFTISVAVKLNVLSLCVKWFNLHLKHKTISAVGEKTNVLHLLNKLDIVWCY